MLGFPAELLFGFGSVAAADHDFGRSEQTFVGVGMGELGTDPA
jgi:hypothetical protein